MQKSINVIKNSSIIKRLCDACLEMETKQQTRNSTNKQKQQITNITVTNYIQDLWPSMLQKDDLIAICLVKCFCLSRLLTGNWQVFCLTRFFLKAEFRKPWLKQTSKDETAWNILKQCILNPVLSYLFSYLVKGRHISILKTSLSTSPSFPTALGMGHST